jgi:hypothetical protein
MPATPLRADDDRQQFEESLMPYLAMAAYRCEVAGEPTDSLDIQVRYFDQTSQRKVEEPLRSEPPHSYANEAEEAVTWPLAGVLAIEEFDEPKSGAEIIGFITGAHEFAKWASGEEQWPYIATRELTAVRAQQGEFPVRVAIGQPYRVAAGEWACAVKLDGLYGGLSDQHAADSFQALMLAQNLLRSLLARFVHDGGQLFDSPGGSLVSVEELFRTGAA